jgi:hypothetical protein
MLYVNGGRKRVWRAVLAKHALVAVAAAVGEEVELALELHVEPSANPCT